jgi:signal transduction histidine kinase
VARLRLWQRFWLGLLVAGPVLLLILRLRPALDVEILHNPPVHLLITLAASTIGVGLALLVLHVAWRAEDARIFLIGMGFLASAGVFVTHSLSTPNVLMTGRGMATSVSALLSLLLGGIFFALSGLNLGSAIDRLLIRRRRAWLGIFLACFVVYNWFMLVSPPMAMSASMREQPPAATPAHAHPDDEYEYSGGYGAPELHAAESEHEVQLSLSPDEPSALDITQLVLVIIGLGCYALALARHYAIYRRSASPAGLGLVFGIAFFGEALLTQYFSQVYTASFWLYHAQEFIGFGVIAAAVLVAYRRGISEEGLLESLFLGATRARMQAHYAQAMQALIDTLSRGEQPPQELRERFGMSESQVRVLEDAARAVAEERRERHELERLNAALRQAEEHKRQLNQMIVHDLKTPLTAMIGFVEILRLGQLDDDQRTLAESALRSGRNLSDLIGDLLDVGRLEEGQLELEHSTFAPRDLLVACASELRGWLAQESKTLAIAAADDVPLLSADLRLLRRVILNLLSNAIKHTPLGTRITLRAFPYVASTRAGEPGNASLVIEVEDDGLGIPPEQLEHIFEKFGHFNRQPNARQDSTGLGLTFCRLVVEAHGGTIGVSSGVGRGTTFRVILPIA